MCFDEVTLRLSGTAFGERSPPQTLSAGHDHPAPVICTELGKRTPAVCGRVERAKRDLSLAYQFEQERSLESPVLEYIEPTSRGRDRESRTSLAELEYPCASRSAASDDTAWA